MILSALCCLFIFLGMFIGEKYDLKKTSIHIIFGLFIVNFLVSLIPYVYSYLYVNYHSSTLMYVLLSIILGYLLIRLVNYTYEDSDNLSILGFTLFNTSLFCLHKFNILFLIINIFYYIFIGIYIKKSKSWIYVFIGCVLGILFSLINSWIMGYIFGINVGFLLYFILSVYNIVFRGNDKVCNIGLIIGLVVALFGGLL